MAEPKYKITCGHCNQPFETEEFLRIPLCRPCFLMGHRGYHASCWKCKQSEQEIWNQAMEEAAKVADSWEDEDKVNPARYIAKAIRALIPSTSISQPSEPEKIASAAIRKNGVVYPCWAHAFLEIKRMNLHAPDDVMKHAEQGFVTSIGRFVDRKEALAIACMAEQVIYKHHPQDKLLSEDLRPVASLSPERVDTPPDQNLEK